MPLDSTSVQDLICMTGHLCYWAAVAIYVLCYVLLRVLSEICCVRCARAAGMEHERSSPAAPVGQDWFSRFGPASPQSWAALPIARIICAVFVCPGSVPCAFDVWISSSFDSYYLDDNLCAVGSRRKTFRVISGREFPSNHYPQGPCSTTYNM